MGIEKEYRLSNKFEQNILSVIFDADSFFYAISNHKQELISAVRYNIDIDPVKEVKEIILKEQLDSIDFSTTKIFSRRPFFSFIPLEEYNYDEESSFIRNAFPSRSGELTVNAFEEEGINILHEYENGFTESLSQIAKNSNVQHISIAWMKGITKDGIHVLYEKSHLSIFVRKKQKFIYFNMFKLSSMQDAMYYILLSYKQLELSAREFPLYINGDLESRHELLALLSNYVMNIITSKKGFVNIEDSSDIFDLYLVSQCV